MSRQLLWKNLCRVGNVLRPIEPLELSIYAHKGYNWTRKKKSLDQLLLDKSSIHVCTWRSSNILSFSMGFFIVAVVLVWLFRLVSWKM